MIQHSLGIEDEFQANFQTAGKSVDELKNSLSGLEKELKELEKSSSIPDPAEWLQQQGFETAEQARYGMERYNREFKKGVEQSEEAIGVTKANIKLIKERIKFLQDNKIVIKENSWSLLTS